MDMTVVVGLVTVILGSIPAIIGARALLIKAQTPTHRAANALRSLWDWLEYKGYQNEVPERLRRFTLRVLEEDHDHNRNDQEQ